jgi:hypothetical protein
LSKICISIFELCKSLSISFSFKSCKFYILSNMVLLFLNKAMCV